MKLGSPKAKGKQPTQSIFTEEEITNLPLAQLQQQLMFEKYCY